MDLGQGYSSNCSRFTAKKGDKWYIKLIKYYYKNERKTYNWVFFLGFDLNCSQPVISWFRGRCLLVEGCSHTAGYLTKLNRGKTLAWYTWLTQVQMLWGFCLYQSQTIKAFLGSKLIFNYLRSFSKWVKNYVTPCTFEESWR